MTAVDTANFTLETCAKALACNINIVLIVIYYFLNNNDQSTGVPSWFEPAPAELLTFVKGPYEV